MDTIGEKLKEARLQRGLTIGDLQKITKIQRRYLEAIEENDFDAMPSDYYTRTFIRQFSEAVGLNPRPLIRRLDGKPEEDNSTGSLLSPMIPVKGSRKAKYSTNTKKAKVKSYVPVVLLSLVVIAIISSIGYAIFLDAEKGPIVPKPEKTTFVDNNDSSIASSDKVVESSTSSETESSSTKETEKKPASSFKLIEDTGELVSFSGKNVEKPVKLEFEGLEGPAWIGLQASGTGDLFYQYTLQPGEKLETFVPEDIDDLDVIFGAATNSKLIVNGSDINFNSKHAVTGKKIVTLQLSGSDKPSKE
ncbi:MAG: helix-turn-helix domain-containing protein [Vagococcus sp.]